MRILFLAPHPFYVDRGTPIDVDIFLRALTQRPDVFVDLVVYREGEDREYRNVTLHRVGGGRLGSGLLPGFSLKKIYCDLWMLKKALSLARKRSYDVVHAGEEAVFVALILKVLYGIPFVYDLDSSIAQQMVEQNRFFRFLSPVFTVLEAKAIRSALATAPVCDALAELCRARGSRKVAPIYDISQLERPGRAPTGAIRQEVGGEGVIFLYVGNLQAYQGVDLLLESFAVACRQSSGIRLVVIGGTKRQIEEYERKAAALGVAGHSSFLGPRPFERLEEYLADADVLVVPRIRGVNTPMKVFPFLHSGRPVLVTDLPTHSQILTPEVAMMAKPTPAAFGEAIARLAQDAELRSRLGRKGREFVEANHTFAAHKRRVDALYDWVSAEVGASA